MKTFIPLCLLAIVYCHTCYAQFNDDFTDNNFTSDPLWTGDDGKFIVAANQLKLQAPASASTAFLSTSSAAINNASWEFLVHLDFNPSGTNLSHVYLVSDRATLTGALNGYFVKIGNTADEISLYRQDGSSEVKIIDGRDGILNVSTVKTRIKITRDDRGNWALFSDVGLTGTYIAEGTITDQTYKASGFFGVSCKYTDTRSDKFRFDDFVITGDPFVDIDPPLLQQLKTISDHELELIFSEPLDATAAERQENYLANAGIGNPSEIAVMENATTVRLSFAKNFPNGRACTLAVSGLQDVNRNVLVSVEKSFLFFQPTPTKWKDLVITEIMADPTPQVAMPNAEYIEIFNKSAAPVDLANWFFAEGISAEKISSSILLPGEYLLFTSTSNAATLSAYGNVVGLNNFPTQTNSGDVIVLKNAEGFTIDSVRYKDSWYKDDDKKQGGWSLELIDPMNTCAESDNWIASENDGGGTPGIQNSVYANKPDVTGPRLVGAIPITAATLTLTFNEKLEHTLPPLTAFNFTPPLIVKEISFVDASLTTLEVVFNENMINTETYTLSATDLYDCAGNTIQSEFNTITFGLPEKPDSLDVVINEVLFNPKPTGVDFVEVYNRSSKHINLKNWSIANLEEGEVVNRKPIASSDLLLKPFSYVVLTTDAAILKSEYPNAKDENFLSLTLPGLSDDEGSIAILDENENVIDALIYTDKMHSIFINDTEGVSLERIAFDMPTNSIQNWRSANSTAGFSTPGYRNSNVYETQQLLAHESVSIEPEIFIPSYGNPNFAEIRYNFSQGGNLATVKIYDLEGREIKQLASNELLGTEGFFRWDGDLNNGTKARVGYYVVKFEIVNTTGSIKTFHKRVIVATKF